MKKLTEKYSALKKPFQYSEVNLMLAKLDQARPLDFLGGKYSFFDC